MKKAPWICSCLMLTAAVVTTQATTWFVDAYRGDDANSGRTAAQPFLTIQKAVDEAALRPGPDMIQIAEGQYVENLVIEDPSSVTLSGHPGVEIVAADSGAEVIRITLGNVILADLKVTGGKHGILGTGSATGPVHLTLRKVESTGNSKRGFQAVDVLEVMISDCQFLGNGTDGVKVETDTLDHIRANLTVMNTYISGNGDDGLDLESLGNIRLVNVIVESTIGDDGLSIDDSVSVFMAGCAFLDSAVDGIDIDDTEYVSMIFTVSARNGGAGLQIKAEADYNTQWIRIVGCNFLDNGADGVGIGEENTMVETVNMGFITTTGNVESGLEIDVSGTIKLHAITSENNGQPDVP